MVKNLDRDGDEIKPISLTFSKKNEDVYYILKDIAKDGTKKTEYICNAVRFFYENQDNVNRTTRNTSDVSSLNKEVIEDIVAKKVAEILNNSITEQTIDISDIDDKDLADD